MNSLNKSIGEYKYLKISTIIIFLLFTYPTKMNSHYKGIYKTEEEAQLKAEEIGCNGAFQIGDLWMPCMNEKELHQYLMNN